MTEIPVNKWLDYAKNSKLIQEIQYETFEQEETKIKGGRGQIVFAKYKNFHKQVVLKKVTTDGDHSSRERHFIYEVRPLYI